MDKSDIFQRVLAVHKENEEYFLKMPGVFAIGIGLNPDTSAPNSPYCIQVYIDKNFNEAIEIKNSIQPAINGVPVATFLDSPPVLATSEEVSVDKEKYRPLKGGIQIQQESFDLFGTIGCIVKKNPNSFFGLTNSHVVPIEGKKVYQPEAPGCCECSECCQDKIGKVYRSVENMFVDAAIIKLDSDIGWKNSVVDIDGFIEGSFENDEEYLDKKVVKRGRTSFKTHGKVDSICYCSTIGGTEIKDQIKIIKAEGSEVFLAGGDSGSVVLLESTNQVIGLNFAYGDGGSYGVANKISNVITELGIEFLVGEHENAVTGPDKKTQLKRLKKMLNESTDPNVIKINKIINRNINEVLRLVNKNKAVIIVWHRNNGPEMLEKLLNNKSEFDIGIYTTLLNKMGKILYEKGSPNLRLDLLRYQKLFFEQFEKIISML